MTARKTLLQRFWSHAPEARLLTNAGEVRAVWRSNSSAIRWLPTDDTYYLAARLRTAADLPPLFVTQSALLDLESAIHDSRTGVPYGVFAGQFCVNPETQEAYLLIDDVVMAQAELTERDFADQLRAELRALVDHATKRGKLPVGCYMSGIGDDLRLDEEDLTLYRQVFTESWQAVLLHDDSGGAERAALMRFESMTRRLYATPFFELLPDSTSAGSSELTTVLRWSNYRSEQKPSQRERILGDGARTSAKTAPPPGIPVVAEPEVKAPKPEGKAPKSDVKAQKPETVVASPRRPAANARLVFINGEIVAFSDERRELR